MAHFAQLDENNNVVNVIVIADEYEAEGERYCSETFGGRWIQTSYTNRIRGTFAGIGYKYDPETDKFIAPEQPKLKTVVSDPIED